MEYVSRHPLPSLAVLLLAIWCVGILGRGYFTPDEPREADLSWRMSVQEGKAVPLLAGTPFTEKPPLTYWFAALPIDWWGKSPAAARAPNLLYALLTALGVALIARRALGAQAALVAAGTISTLLLCYQVSIWLATDAPLLAFTSLALWGLYNGFHATESRSRLGWYSLMHGAMALGFLSKSAVAFMVPALTFGALIFWERRFRELLRWELYAGLAIQCLLIGSWVLTVYHGPDGPAQLKAFFWNNLVGRFTQVDAAPELQYATGHKNSPGKYLLELPVYLFPWDLLCVAALVRAWRSRKSLAPHGPLIRFAVASFVPALLLLSLAATARNVYLAPALPGMALLIAWWSRALLHERTAFDLFALKGTAILLGVSILALTLALVIVGMDGWDANLPKLSFTLIGGTGLVVATFLAFSAWNRRDAVGALSPLFAAYAALLIGPLSQLYARANDWQDLQALGQRIEAGAQGHQLVLYRPDETTRAMVDLYARPEVRLIVSPSEASADERVLVQLPGRGAPSSAAVARLIRYRAPKESIDLPGLHLLSRYELPNGRRYGLYAAD